MLVGKALMRGKLVEDVGGSIVSTSRERSNFGDEHATAKKHLKISFNPTVYAQSAWMRIAVKTGTAGRAWIKASSTKRRLCLSKNTCKRISNDLVMLYWEWRRF
jgi:hypothetical protein